MEIAVQQAGWACSLNRNKSAITDHVAKENHVIDWSGAKILDIEKVIGERQDNSRSQSVYARRPTVWPEMWGPITFQWPMTVFWSRAHRQRHVTICLMKFAVGERNVAIRYIYLALGCVIWIWLSYLIQPDERLQTYTAIIICILKTDFDLIRAGVTNVTYTAWSCWNNYKVGLRQRRSSHACFPRHKSRTSHGKWWWRQRYEHAVDVIVLCTVYR